VVVFGGDDDDDDGTSLINSGYLHNRWTGLIKIEPGD